MRSGARGSGCCIAPPFHRRERWPSSSAEPAQTEVGVLGRGGVGSLETPAATCRSQLRAVPHGTPGRIPPGPRGLRPLLACPQRAMLRPPRMCGLTPSVICCTFPGPSAPKRRSSGDPFGGLARTDCLPVRSGRGPFRAAPQGLGTDEVSPRDGARVGIGRDLPAGVSDSRCRPVVDSIL